MREEPSYDGGQWERGPPMMSVGEGPSFDSGQWERGLLIMVVSGGRALLHW